ncbi:hypothetical protein BN903_64 [Halorubrum sp. AJ67]|nr:hypothetical protein BN903_64 [Halorubrum sp. AJ67]
MYSNKGRHRGYQVADVLVFAYISNEQTHRNSGTIWMANGQTPPPPFPQLRDSTGRLLKLRLTGCWCSGHSF